MQKGETTRKGIWSLWDHSQISWFSVPVWNTVVTPSWGGSNQTGSKVVKCPCRDANLLRFINLTSPNKLRHYWWIEVYTRSEHGKSVKQYARIVWASLISSLEVARYECLPHRFSPTFQPPLFNVEIEKKPVNRCNF